MERFKRLLLFLLVLLLMGCMPPHLQHGWISDTGANFNGGGEDAVTIDLPFHEGYVSQCTQCAGGSYSHNATSTRYDIDLDTPNDIQDEVFTPVSGTAYVHNQSPSTGFGVHVNIDLGDGTYIILGHLSEVFIENGAQVAAGQLIGYEGTTGASSGDHVHMGRHAGYAERNAVHGGSSAGLWIYAEDTTNGLTTGRQTSEMVCGLSNGHQYRSKLKTGLWHPDGALVKSPSASTIYRLQNGQKHPFQTDVDFWQNSHDFTDVALVSEQEMSCYAEGSAVSGENFAYAAYDGQDIWMLVREQGVHTAHRVSHAYWQDVVASWGQGTHTVEDLLTTQSFPVPFADFTIGGEARFREGALIREESDPTVYMISGGVAMPIENWNVFLLMGYQQEDIQWVSDGAVASVQPYVGNCMLNTFCVTHEDVTTCGGPEHEGLPGETDVDTDTDADTDSDTDSDTDTDSDADTDTDTGALPTTSCDADADSFFALACGGTDCNDNQSTIYPGAVEVCDYVDNNCNGSVDEGVSTTYYLDADGDGYGDGNEPREACTWPNAYSMTGDDCDDSSIHVNPGLQDVWDLRDNNCNGQVDESGMVLYSRYYFAHAFDDWEHRVSATSLGAPWVSDGHVLELYPVNVCSDLAYQPFDECILQDGGKTIRLQNDYELMAIAQCTGVLDGYHLSLLLEERGGEYASYSQNVDFTCQRIGYTFADESARNARGDFVPVYRHRSPPMTGSGPPRTGVADNMWSILPCEYDHACNPTVPEAYDYDEHELVWWAPNGSY